MQKAITQEIPAVVEAVAATRTAGVTTGGQQQLQQLRQLQPGSPAMASPTAASTASHLRPAPNPPTATPPAPAPGPAPLWSAATALHCRVTANHLPATREGAARATQPHRLTSATTCLQLCELQGCNPAPCTPYHPPEAQAYPRRDCNQGQQYNQQWSQGYQNQGRRPPYQGTVTVELHTRGAGTQWPASPDGPCQLLLPVPARTLLVHPTGCQGAGGRVPQGCLCSVRLFPHTGLRISSGFKQAVVTFYFLFVPLPFFSSSSPLPPSGLKICVPLLGPTVRLQGWGWGGGCFLSSPPSPARALQLPRHQTLMQLVVNSSKS